MKLDRNTQGQGKYAVVNLRKVAECKDLDAGDMKYALECLEQHGVLEYGAPNTPGEFFVLKLCDRFAQAALRSYAMAALVRDPEYAKEVEELADRAGLDSPWCKFPD